jgi:hypothetical protein
MVKVSHLCIFLILTHLKPKRTVIVANLKYAWEESAGCIGVKSLVPHYGGICTHRLPLARPNHITRDYRSGFATVRVAISLQHVHGVVAQ